MSEISDEFAAYGRAVCYAQLIGYDLDSIRILDSISRGVSVSREDLYEIQAKWSRKTRNFSINPGRGQGCAFAVSIEKGTDSADDTDFRPLFTVMRFVPCSVVLTRRCLTFAGYPRRDSRSLAIACGVVVASLWVRRFANESELRRVTLHGAFARSTIIRGNRGMRLSFDTRSIK
jgi:hypothetical protein